MTREEAMAILKKLTADDLIKLEQMIDELDRQRKTKGKLVVVDRVGVKEGKEAKDA